MNALLSLSPAAAADADGAKCATADADEDETVIANNRGVIAGPVVFASKSRVEETLEFS